MKPDRLTELVLERRFGTPDAAAAAELAAWSATAEGAAEVARLEAMLDAAPAAGTAASARFADSLATRLEAEDAAAAKNERRSLFRRAAAVYCGIALGAFFYAAWAGWFSDAAPETIAGYSAALDQLSAGLPR
jgi:hypothetical protein